MADEIIDLGGDVEFPLELESDNEEFEFSAPANPTPEDEDNDDEVPKKKKSDDNHTQWALGPNNRFMAVGSTVKTLPPGIYEPFQVPGQWGLERLDIASDGIYTLPDMATEEVLREVNKFWSSEAKYREHKLLYKRGLILFGPPGGGKTVTVKILMNELVKNGGIVVNAYNINLTILCLKAIRRIEPRRNLIVVLEDLDEILRYNGEASVLSMLDGENNVDNVLTLATTNFPDRLGARIINRPSRFDRRIEVGMPGPQARASYIEQATKGVLDSKTIKRWVHDTEGMSIAHLRELVAAVYCLEQPYSEVIGRLQEMAKMVKTELEFKQASMGFGRSSSLRAKPSGGGF